MRRRDLIKLGTMVSASFLMPGFAMAKPFVEERKNRRVLVIIQLSGGNDGLNTIVPYQNDIYYRSRPRLAISKNDIIKIDDHAGFHPSLSSLHRLHERGAVSIINSVGYPDPNRSHFRSTDIWHTGSGSEEIINTGWIGRMLDNRSDVDPFSAIEISGSLSLALKGKNSKGMAVADPVSLYRQTQQPFIQSVSTNPKSSDTNHSELDHIHSTLHNTCESASYIYQKYNAHQSKINYPNSDLAKGLSIIASLIVSDCDTSVYSISHTGYDTHVGQTSKQKRLLKQYDEAIGAFTNELMENERFNDVAILTFSEFGRRVAQNASGGTDHGAANCAWVVSGGLKQPGIINPMPDLSDLQNGDLKHSVDFRDLYATLLKGWMDQDPAMVLKGDRKQLGFI